VSRVDYSELVDALVQGDEQTADRLLKELIPRLKEYLRVVMGANREEGEECVQRALLGVIEQIRKRNIRNSKTIFSYLIKACRHEYIHHKKYEQRFHYTEDMDRGMSEPAQQITDLLDQERQEILKSCLDELDQSSRKFILHFLLNPDTTTKEASSSFGLSPANVRTRKSRLISRLHDCCMRKLRS